jgi:transcriptional regulator with PAS, ATPase and Fis domain
MDIAFIAPFERLRIKAQSIIDTSNYPARTYLGDLQKGAASAKLAWRDGAKIISSKGGTARLIRQQLDVEVIEVGGSIYRTLALLYENTSQETKIAIVGFKQLMNFVEPICDILGRSYQSFVIKESASFTEVIQKVKRWQPDIVIGDAISFHWAKDHALNVYLIESSMEAIVDAFERAMLVLKNLNRHISKFYAKYTFADICYRCDRMRNLVEIAKQYSRTDSNIMIMGETGTGKELFAQSIHNAGPLAGGPFVAVNCAALSGSLLESELFGYAPGAFTGALRSGKTSLFELANDGTLFLDELAEMDIFLQSKLLRALQTREIMKIGDNKVIPINVRIIAATNK